jgi:hypothetical protein
MSYQAIAEVTENDNAETSCLVCTKPVNIGDQIILNGTSEEVETLRKQLGTKKATKRKLPENSKEVEVGPLKRPAISSSGEIAALRLTKNIQELYAKR